MKTIFSRLFSMIAALLMLCLLITGVAFRFLMMSWVESEKRKSLSADASALADLAEAYDSAGELESNWNFQIGLSLFSEVGEVSAMICDEDGYVVICSCDNLTCDHVGKQVPESYRREMLREGVYYEKNVRLADIYDDARFLAGQAVVNDQTGNLVGFVVVTAPMNQTTDYMLRSSTFFIYTAIGALGLALVAATFLSRSLVRPLGQMADVARRFGYGETKLRAEQTKSNTREVNDLALAFNTMADSLEQSEQRRQEFIANVSHELKTPMTTIGGYVDGILDGTIPKETEKHYLQIVSSEVRRLSRLVRSMLDLSRIQAQGLDESRKSRFDLGEAMSDVLITFEQKINARALQVSVDLPEKPVWTKADRDAITQVIYNLLDNAIKFCPVGGSLALVLEQDGQKARLRVRNTGQTIPAEELPLLFDRFHKADKARSADREGWGLGLYIAKTIVGAHGGEIWATSENGVTEFCFTLPVVR
jgi:signal transduction histidine kinase